MQWPIGVSVAASSIVTRVVVVVGDIEPIDAASLTTRKLAVWRLLWLPPTQGVADHGVGRAVERDDAADVVGVEEAEEDAVQPRMDANDLTRPQFSPAACLRREQRRRRQCRRAASGSLVTGSSTASEVGEPPICNT